MPEEIETKEFDPEDKTFRKTSHRIIHRRGRQELVISHDILTLVLDIPAGRQTRADQMRLADVMKALKWNRTSNSKISIPGREPPQVRGYFRGGDEQEADPNSRPPDPEDDLDFG